MFVVDNSNQRTASLALIDSVQEHPKKIPEKFKVMLYKLEAISRKIDSIKNESISDDDFYVRLQEIVSDHMSIDNDVKTLTGGAIKKDSKQATEKKYNDMSIEEAVELIHKLQQDEIDNMRDGKQEFGVPKVSLPKLSKYEFAGIITSIANYLTTRSTLYPLVSEDCVVKGLINPSAVAYEAIKKGRIDVIIDRGYERVLLSKMKINPIWEKDLENFFKRWFEAAYKTSEYMHEAMKNYTDG